MVTSVSRREYLRGTLINASLRGSLAEKYVGLCESAGIERALSFVEALLTLNDPDIVRVQSAEQIVVGLASERGLYPPDW